MNVISFVNNKGGVGKTSLCVNLAALKSLERPVMVVDLDEQENASYVFSKEEGRGYRYGESDLYLEKSTRMLSRRELRELGYKDVYVDTKAYLDEVTIEVIKISDVVVVPIFLDVYSVQGLGKVLGLIKRYNDRARVIIVPNMTVHNSRLHKGLYKDIKKSLGKDYEISEVLSTSVKMQESVRDGEIFILGEMKSRNRLAKGIRKLGELIDHV